MARVELEKVAKVYAGNVTAVDHIDLSIKDREFIVLVGPSGCGKSTTLRMVAGLEEITAGTIKIGERVVNNVAPKDRDIAMVFQNYALYPHMSVYKNMAFGLMLRKLPKAEIQRRVMETAKILEIEHLLERKPKALSGGQRQRVAVGRAIVREPAAFLFDEPLSNLDAKLRVTTRAELKRLHQRLQTTTIYVTHDQEEAMTLGDRIVCMKDGRIQQAETPLKMYQNPANRFVAEFIGMPPMNFFNGALKMVNGEMIFQEGKLTRTGARDEDGVYEGELTLPDGGFTVPVLEGVRDVLAGKVGSHIVLGVRPEHFSPVKPSGPSAKVSLNVRVVEPLGKEVDVYLTSVLSDRVVARVEAESGLQMDSKVDLYIDLRKVHFFEPGKTGMNLTAANQLSHAHA